MKKKIFTFLLTVCLLSGCNLFKKQNETNNNNQKEASMCDVMLYYGEDVEPNSSYGVAGDLFVKSSGAYYVKRGENIEYVNNLGQLVNGNYDGRWVHCGDFIAENQRGHERIDLPSLYMDAVPLTSDLGIAGDFYLYKDSLNFYYKGRSGWISRPARRGDLARRRP